MARDKTFDVALFPQIEKKIFEGGGWARINELPGGVDYIWELIDAGILEHDGGNYVRFKAGKNPVSARKITVPALPKSATCIGKLIAVEYQSNLLDGAGKTRVYRHTFGAKSRPLLAATHDGQLLVLFGGTVRFTKRGIVG